MGTYIDLTGQRFGKLQAQRVTAKGSRGENLWECLCDCGRTHTVGTGQLRAGNAISCGCISGRRKRPQLRPPKQAAPVVGGRAIDRLSAADRERIRVNAEAFVAYAKMRKEFAR